MDLNPNLHLARNRHRCRHRTIKHFQHLYIPLKDLGSFLNNRLQISQAERLDQKTSFSLSVGKRCVTRPRRTPCYHHG